MKKKIKLYKYNQKSAKMRFFYLSETCKSFAIIESYF